MPITGKRQKGRRSRQNDSAIISIVQEDCGDVMANSSFRKVLFRLVAIQNERVVHHTLCSFVCKDNYYLMIIMV